MMRRTKIITEPTDLIPMFHVVNTEFKREIFKEISSAWCTETEIVERYGEEGKSVLQLFEKTKLVSIKWEASNPPVKAYRSYYTSFHINTTCPVTEISDILYVATMSDDDFKKIEKKILKIIGEEGKFAGNVSEELKISPIMLRGLTKRSEKVEYRGHRIENRKG